MVKIRLKRFGAKKRPYYRIVVIDSCAPRQGRTIDEIGYYHPIEVRGNMVKLDKEKFQHWISKGAHATRIVQQLIKKASIMEVR